MKTPEFEKISSPEKKDVLLKVLISRHGPKLQAAGEKNVLASYFKEAVTKGFNDMGIEKGTGAVHISGSPVERSKETMAIMSEAAGVERKSGEEKNLATPFQPAQEAENTEAAEDFEKLVAWQAKLEPLIRESVFKDLPHANHIEQEAEIRNRIDMEVLTAMFNEGDKTAQERKFKTTYKDLADRFASRYAGFLSHLGILDKFRQKGGTQPLQTPYIQIDVSHSFPITAFLKKYLVFADGQRAETLDAKKIYKKTGGIIRESGFLRLEYCKDEPPYVEIEAEFAPGKPFKGCIEF